MKSWNTLSLEKIFMIQRLAALGYSAISIAHRAEVGLTTVYRHTPKRGRTYVRKELHKPLYDPVRDGSPDMSITAQLCGDPAPGRREMVAGNRGWATD